MPPGSGNAINVFFEDRSFRISKEEVRYTAARVLELENSKSKDINIIFTGNRQIRKLKKRYFGINTVTDVISFNMDDHLLGEIYISLPRARAQANENGISIKTEVKRLIIHGVLHLLGYDHEDADDYNTMFDKQELYLKLAVKQ